MSKAIDDLKHEHEAITSALTILDRIVARIADGIDPDQADLMDFIEFLKEFADKCHHGKEEGILFPSLTMAGIPEKGGPIGVMLSEHVKGRNLIKDMEASLTKGTDYEKFASAAREYSLLLKNHIEKENSVLFPAAERILNSSQLEQIYVSFEEHEEKVIGQGRHEALHTMLKGLESKYAP